VAANQDQNARDEALAFKFASLPIGREALPNIEVHVDDIRRNHRSGQAIWKFERGLPEILWSRFLTDETYASLIKWTEGISVERPDLGERKAYYLTAESLEKAMSDGEPPLDINDPDFARTILIFAALLPPAETASLVAMAGRMGVEAFRALGDGASAGSLAQPAVDDQELVSEFNQAVPPRLDAEPQYKSVPAAMPAPSDLAISISKDLEDAIGTATQAYAGALQVIPEYPAAMMSVPDVNFNAMFAAIQSARSARHFQTAAEEKARAFIVSQLTVAFQRTEITLSPSALVDHLDFSQLPQNALAADAVSQLSAYIEYEGVGELWSPRFPEHCSLEQVLDAFRELPHANEFLDRKKRELTQFAADVRNFIAGDAGQTPAIKDWLTSLSAVELLALADEVGTSEWPVLKAILQRLGLDKSPSSAKALQRTVCAAENDQLRRDLLHYTDPTAIVFDEYPELQRVITAERLLDIITFGPIEAISDPSLRLGSADLVGASISELLNLLVQHLDLLGNGSELRELAAFRATKANFTSGSGPERDLISFAMTPSISSGFYLLLREAVRERYFLPLVREGKIDAVAAGALAADFEVDDAIERAVLDVRKSSNRAARIESRHRARVHSYVRSGKELLDAFVRFSKPVKSARRTLFASELQRQLGLLHTTHTAMGSREWLESRVGEIICGQGHAPDLPTLRGEGKPLGQHVWAANDTAWAQQSIDLPEFYSPRTIAPIDVAAAALRQWNAGRHLAPEDILEGLLKQGLYGEALSFIEEAVPDAVDRSSLNARVAKEASAAITPVAERFRDLQACNEESLLGTIPTSDAVRSAISRYDVRLAEEQLDLLEMEIQEAIELRRLDAIDASKAREKAEVLNRLLRAGVQGPDEKWRFADLQNKWIETLSNQVVQRAHLRVVEKALDSHGALPELNEDVERFAEYSLDPANWLPQERALDLSGFLEDAADKLRTWGQLAGQLSDPQQRTALIEIIRWFVGFVEEQTAALKALDESESSDNLLERALEAAETIEQAPDPLACAHNLGFIGETIQESLAQPDRVTPTSASANAIILPFAERGDWGALGEAARSLRVVMGDDDGRRMADIAEFAETVAVINEGNVKAARDGIPVAAKVLVTHGNTINRALNQTQQLQIAYQLLVASMVAGDEAANGIPPRLPPDRSWAAIAGRKVQFQQVFAGGGLASRTLEQLCSGSLGREIVNRLWDAPTATSEPGPFRAALLGFLYERRLNEHLLSLAQRHEPGIRPRLEQLLNLRSIASQRPDLVPVSEAVAEQIIKAAQGVPFRLFVSGLPTAAKAIDADLIVSVDNDIILRIDRQKIAELSVAISIEPRGLVPEYIEAVLFPDDDVSFEDGSRRAKLSTSPLYFANQFTASVKFGASWTDASSKGADNFRIRINARVLAGELINRDVVCQLIRSNARSDTQLRIDDDTLLEAFPGVESTPASGESFIGRHDELEKLHNALIGARRPSPVLLTGMRRIGKTSLLYAFHGRHRQPDRNTPVTVYFSLAERRGAMMDPGQSVSSVFFSAIAQALGKRHFSSNDLNRELGEKLKQKFGSERDAIRNAILELRDPESVADSLTILSENLLDWIGGAPRIIYLIDEADTLVLPYKGGDAKRLELEQLLQGLREVSQTSTKVGLLLCGSNHIDEFTQSYKEAFFGSSVQIPLSGMTATETARKLISPDKLAPYVKFTGEPVRYAIDLCAGMPQFLWQLGAATSAIVRSGPVSKADVRQGVSVLVGERTLDLPFKAYEVLEPIEHMLGLQGQREQDLYWLLLYKVANSSSLVVDEAQQSFIIDQSLLELDEFEGWKQRLISLCSLSILEMTRPAMYRFKVPIFAEGFRALRQHQKYLIRHQRAAT
jgi:hypothetical protein